MIITPKQPAAMDKPSAYEPRRIALSRTQMALRSLSAYLMDSGEGRTPTADEAREWADALYSARFYLRDYEGFAYKLHPADPLRNEPVIHSYERTKPTTTAYNHHRRR